MSLQPIKHKHGVYKKLADGSAKLVTHHDVIGLKKEMTIGFTYEVKSEEAQTLKVLNEYCYPDGKVTSNGYTIDTNELFGSILTLHTIKNDMVGKMTFRVSFPDHPALPALEQVFFLYKHEMGMLFKDLPFAPATQQNIDDYEARYRVTLCDDYKTFLTGMNGLDLVWWQDTTVFDTEQGAYESDEYGFMQTHYPFYKQLNKLKEDWGWHFEVCKLFGLGHRDPRIDMGGFYMPSLFYHDDLVTYAYPIGQDDGGNAMVQIAQGKYRGKLAMIDHEVSSSMIDWIEGKTSEVYAIPPEKATADGFLEDCFEYGGLTLVDISFDDFLKQLLEKHELVYQEMKKDFGY